MHSRVFEISTTPIDAKDQFNTSQLPEWFFHTIADSGDDVPDAEREGSLDWFVRRFGDNCHRDGDKVSFEPQMKTDYFKKSHEAFLSAASTLTKCSLDEFSGVAPQSEFFRALFTLKSSFENQYSFYVYNKEIDELITMDQWVRNADLTQSYYIGGIIDYHW